MMEKLYKYYFTALASLFLPSIAFANDIDVGASSSLAATLCSIRVIFCGGGGLAIATITITVVGFMALTNKLHWSFILIMSAALIVFANAELVAEAFMDGRRVECDCD